ncbi:MAG: YceI family protein [Sulfuriferula multivorans]|uniref:YceI family protein n=1 Tax=Sulfuriferula multivorans TaxID=1559896 RepID=A0A7C9P8X1_9PROT|nr:YceI family protein [Sulfuriferula multivorans]
MNPTRWKTKNRGKLTFSINRSDYGIMKFVDGGKGLVGNEVDITLLVEALKLGPDGQPVNMKTQPAANPSTQPVTPVEPVKKPGKPDLNDMFRGIFK